MFFKLGVLKDFANFTGKHLYWCLFLTNFIKKRLQHRCFHVKFANFLRTPFPTELENLIKAELKFLFQNSSKRKVIVWNVMCGIYKNRNAKMQKKASFKRFPELFETRN